MHFRVSPLTASGIVPALALHIILLLCRTGDAGAQGELSYTFVRDSPDNDSPTTVQPGQDSEQPYAVELSDMVYNPETAGADADAEPTGPPEAGPGTRWVQRIPKGAAVRSGKSAQPQALPSDDSPVWFGQVLSNVLYGGWPGQDTSPACARDLNTYRQYVKTSTLWAIKMLDASAKGPEGLLTGNTASFGNFEQCVGTSSKRTGVAGGYSLIDIDFRPTYDVYPDFYNNDHSRDYLPDDDEESVWEAIKDNIQVEYVQRHRYQWAVCLPDTCKVEDVHNIVSNALLPELKRNGLEGNISVDPTLHTSKYTTYKYTAGFYLVITGFLLLIGLVGAGTAYDFVFLYYRPKSEHGPLKKIMKPFSLISNIERLLKPSESDEFSVINGLKVCCILQVILGHRNILEYGYPQMDSDWVYWTLHNFMCNYFKCIVFLETFFVISGFLTYIMITKQLEQKKQLNFIPIMIYRWLRIFPVYAALIVTYIFVLPYMNSGPYWQNIVYRESERCQKNWWTNVLFINNYVHTDELCIIPAWYLACDMHFFIVGTLLTYVMWRWQELGRWALGVCIAASTIIPAYMIYVGNYQTVGPLDAASLKDLAKTSYYTDVYIKSHMRATPYFIGMAAAYIYKRLKESDYKVSLKNRIIWIPICVVVGNLVYLGTSVFYTFGIGLPYSSLKHSMYFTISRLAWSLIMSYTIVVHGVTGLGVIFSGFLGHRMFQVFGKLVFCIYVFQEIIQLQTVGSIKYPIYQDFTTITMKFGGDLFVAVVYAFIMNVTVESPFDRLQKNVMKMFYGEMFIKKTKEHLPEVQTEFTLKDSKA
ncbi:nose resistant to fluoxetine protein 6-like [Adelges cooleyi]|uniref:nose resistant to fluoxetine protein 6-like n=1 Tax=Adelges cooleyi TaxID=133065 RepID=UPI00217F5C23|nr:nose resistant to fluoxetine protein 6-like [Adelges cooleyi]